MTNPASSSASGGGAGKPIAVFLLDDHEIVRGASGTCWRPNRISGW